MRKHWQGSNFPKIPKILESMGSAGTMVADILGILGASDVAKMLPGSNFPKVSEARSANTGRDQISPKFLKCWHLWEVRGP